jgi:N-formylglutamate amidohydrolase
MPMYARKLSVAEVGRRIDTYWRPYHDALAAVIDARHREFGSVWHIDCHSMPAVGDVLADDPGRKRADLVLGDRDGTTCAPEFTHFVRDVFTARGYVVAVNDPYKGVEIVRRHGRPAEGRHSLQVEINRRLYMDENSLATNARYELLARDLSAFAGELAGWISTRTSAPRA